MGIAHFIDYDRKIVISTGIVIKLCLKYPAKWPEKKNFQLK